MTQKTDLTVIALYTRTKELMEQWNEYQDTLINHLRMKHSVMCSEDKLLEAISDGVSAEKFEELARVRSPKYIKKRDVKSED